MDSFIPKSTPTWDKMRLKRAKDWKKLLDRVLEAGRKSETKCLNEGDLKAVAISRNQLRDDLEELVVEATGNRLKGVRNCASEVLFDLARAKGLHSAKKLASLTASILVRVKPLVAGTAKLSKAAASIALKPLITGLDFGKKVLERLNAMKEATEGGDDPNIDVFIGELAGLIEDMKTKKE